MHELVKLQPEQRAYSPTTLGKLKQMNNAANFLLSSVNDLSGSQVAGLKNLGLLIGVGTITDLHKFSDESARFIDLIENQAA